MQTENVVIYDTICEGQLYNRNGVVPFVAKTSTIKPLFLKDINGCDSLVTINIEVLPASRRDTTIFACKGSSVTIGGKQYFNDIVVTDTLAGVNTCDSIVRTFIEFSETEGYTVEQHRIICAGDTYTDVAFPDGISKAGTYTNSQKSNLLPPHDLIEKLALLHFDILQNVRVGKLSLHKDFIGEYSNLGQGQFKKVLAYTNHDFVKALDSTLSPLLQIASNNGFASWK